MYFPKDPGYRILLSTWEVAEDTDGDGDAGGVSKLQGKFRVT